MPSIKCEGLRYPTHFLKSWGRVFIIFLNTEQNGHIKRVGQTLRVPLLFNETKQVFLRDGSHLRNVRINLLSV